MEKLGEVVAFRICLLSEHFQLYVDVIDLAYLID